MINNTNTNTNINNLNMCEKIILFIFTSNIMFVLIVFMRPYFNLMPYFNANNNGISG